MSVRTQFVRTRVLHFNFISLFLEGVGCLAVVIFAPDFQQPPYRRARRCILEIEVEQVRHTKVAGNCDLRAFPNREGMGKKGTVEGRREHRKFHGQRAQRATNDSDGLEPEMRRQKGASVEGNAPFVRW